MNFYHNREHLVICCCRYHFHSINWCNWTTYSFILILLCQIEERSNDVSQHLAWFSCFCILMIVLSPICNVHFSCHFNFNSDKQKGMQQWQYVKGTKKTTGPRYPGRKLFYFGIEERNIMYNLQSPIAWDNRGIFFGWKIMKEARYIPMRTSCKADFGTIDSFRY